MTSFSNTSSTTSAVRLRFRLAQVGLLLSCACVVYMLSAAGILNTLFTGPGSYSRIFATVVLVLNWKSLPFAWNIRIWYSMILHLLLRDFHAHTPDKLFHPVISESYASIGEIDYRLHKSNSTYLADLDVSRSHLVSHLVARAGHLVVRNAKTHLIMDPSRPSKPARGSFNIGIGAVHCSFKKEIKPYQKYEMWSKVLSWDRKWLYIVTHFVEKGAVKPRSWDAESYGPTRKRAGETRDWEKKIFTTAITTYVFKLGRLTIHPATMLDASGLLPERPGGWTTDAHIVPVPEEPMKLTDESGTEGRREWTWERTELERQKGLKYASHFAALNDAQGLFDGGEDGALGRFSLG
ncbi:capsule polysaccharide biosynthesis protein [Astrocystis sublimbata]|nr:capsule polysaccharide biosynthesis protein [Astrocystis sublimbata]